MKYIFLIAFFIVSAIINIYNFYNIYIAYVYKKRIAPLPDTNKYNFFTILIAARNEASVIGQLINSLQKINYPKDKYEIVVIPNNCTDDTEKIARQLGANIFELKNPVKTKGQVINQVVNELSKADYIDCFAIFDADNLVDENFLYEMNKSISYGNSVSTGFRDSKNPTASYMSSAYTIFYLIMNVFYNRPRKIRGMNSVISGTGFVFTKEFINSIGGWNTYTLTEDNEFTIQNSIYNNNIDYVEKAIIYDEQPETFIQSYFQRLRWSIGGQQNYKGYKNRVIKNIRDKKGKDSFDGLLLISATLMQVLTAVFSVLSILLMFFSLKKVTFIICLSVLIITLFTFPTLLAILVLSFLERPKLPMTKGIISLWFFILSWIPIHMIALFKKNTSWKEIKHKPINTD